MQYSTWSHSYKMALHAALNNPGYRARAKAFAEANGLLKEVSCLKVGKLSRQEVRQLEAAILSEVLEKNLNIT